MSKIYNQFLEDESNNTSKIETSPPKVCSNSTSSSNASDFVAAEDSPTILSSQDEEILSILQELTEEVTISSNNSNFVQLLFLI